MRAWFSSARGQLLGLWVLLAVSAYATGFLFWQFYSQTAARQIFEGQERAARACRTIDDRYRFYTTGWTSASPSIDQNALRKDLAVVVSSALASFVSVEGGIWRQSEGSLAYAFPTYEGSGPKLDLPAAELPIIEQVNEEALTANVPMDRVQKARSQVLIVHARVLTGPLPGLTAWTMTRVYTWTGPAYNRLQWGLALTAFTIVTSTVLLALVLVGWTRRVTRLQQSLGASQVLDLPQLPPTGDLDLDRLVTVLNTTGARLQEARTHATASERLAAVGRLSAGLAHEIRNPLTAMRLKAENALASSDADRARMSLQTILEQISRLEALLRNLLATTHRKELLPQPVDLVRHLLTRADAHRELAERKSVTIALSDTSPVIAECDEEEIARAVDNLLINAIEASPPGGRVTLSAERREKSAILRIQDQGNGVDGSVVDRLFEPFVTSRADGTGLGLAIVREIARSHGGDARYISLERGAAFEIELPAGGPA
jgi:signal transduction histidine kinase